VRSSRGAGSSSTTLSIDELEAMRILFVVTERAGGITPSRRDAYEATRARIASLTGAVVDWAPYWTIENPSADALVLSGSTDPWAMHHQVALGRFYEVLRRYPGPVLGICAGMQMLVRARGGVVSASAQATRGFVTVDVLDDSDLLSGSAPSFEAFQSHEDEVTAIPRGFRVLARSEGCRVEAIAADDRPGWGTQFHPEAWDLEHPVGRAVVERFLELAGVPLR
jgi:GMP synthase-like glutamine amidotransferase